MALEKYKDLDLNKFKEYLKNEAGDDKASLLRLYYDMIYHISNVMNNDNIDKITDNDIDAVLGSISVYSVLINTIYHDLRSLRDGGLTLKEKSNIFDKSCY